MKSSKVLPYGEGTWFAVPLEQGGFAIGVNARFKVSRGGGTALGYFFGPVRSRVPTLDEIVALEPEQAINICRFGDLHLLDGKWPLIGTDPAWDRNRWPFPDFARREPLTSPPRVWRVTYANDDPSQRVREERIQPDDKKLRPDSLSGADAVEKVLSYLLPKGQ